MNKNGKSRKNRIMLATLVFLITGIYSCTAHGEPLSRLKIPEIALGAGGNMR